MRSDLDRPGFLRARPALSTHRFVGASALVWAALWVGGPALASAWSMPDDPNDAKQAELAVNDQRFNQVVAPFLAKYCVSCHQGDEAKGGLQLDGITDQESLVKNRRDFENVLMRLEDGDMPPPNKMPRPSEEESKAVREVIEVILSTFDCTGPVDPGRVTMRRLNKSEYINTIRDLMGVEFEAGVDFPSDDVGYGFDNIGDVLALPPLLMEKYLDAAGEIVEKAIRLPETTRPSVRTLLNQHQVLVSTKGEIAVDLPSGGERWEYVLSIRAWGDQAGSEPVKMGLLVNGQQVKVFEVKADRESRAEVFEHQVRTRAGTNKIAIVFLNDFYQPETRSDRNLHVSAIVAKGPLNGPPPEPTAFQKALFAVGADQRKANEVAATRAILSHFAARAYRRPITRDEADRLTALARKIKRSGASYERSIQVAIQAILVSPHFLFRVEVERPPQGQPATTTSERAAAASPTPPTFAPIGDWELASRLSYFLWSSMPDDELFAAAAQGKLRNEAEIEAQVRRMLRAPKARALAENFGTQWLQIRRLEDATPSRRQFPAFNEALRRDMTEETIRFVEYIFREDRPILDFIQGRYTFANERLAKFYGIDGVQGEEFRRVELTDDRRAGVLTQASVLTVTSNPTRTSPVKRGKYILEQILGTPPPPAPPNVPDLEDNRKARAAATLRQRLEQHRADPNCAVCHIKMDGLGFGMENFDAIGQWRDKDHGQPIDASGELPGGVTFNGPAELRAVLLKSRDQFRKAFTEKLLTYALGRGLDSHDACVVDRLVQATAEDGDRISRLVVEICLSEPFRMRRVQPAQAAPIDLKAAAR
ncbi:protein of unknown function DUF1588 [Isosphaera pallida ATCC 43644]|uniref:Cytochrome c domain-containing protein n=1 Tax=Isosphaera pallida (strain ATCC 43644 / DSM 9630 / IS1B) TaxID=575540 RepID=E8R4E7_ISOPI|nr:DUF1592 domain-containing protein [Isosphaera pallida]ADV63742.1 protein of unknown function DUF1588 [Isosphaera pallida ATCC 43644]